MECIAACTEAPCLQVNYRYFPNVTPATADALLEDLRAGRRATEVPKHGTLARVRQQIPADRRAGNAVPGASEEPVWLRTAAPTAEGAARESPTRRRSSASRWDLDGGHTLDGYLATGGYEGLRAALAKAPHEVRDEVKAASLLGRGGAGFPAGTKWGFCPPGVWPRYVVVNGDESEPGTYKDRILMERDPHQLIEGVLIACYAIGAAQAFLYVRGRDGPRAGADRAGPQRGLRGRLRRQEHPRLRLLRRHRPALGRRRLHRRRGDRAHRVARGQPWDAAPEAAVLPRRQGPVPAAHDRQQRRDAGQPAVDRLQRGRRVRRARCGDQPGHPAVRGVRPRPPPGRLRGRVRRHHLPRPHRGARSTAAACARATTLKAFIPGGASAPWFYEEHLDLPLEAGAVGAAGSMLGSGAVVVMDDTTDAVKACWRVVRFFARESCGKCTPCREGTSWLEKVLRRILDGHGRPEDVGLLLDVCDNISPGITWPPRQTTICPLGPSAVSPIASAIVRFKDEFLRLLRRHRRALRGHRRQGLHRRSPR